MHHMHSNDVLQCCSAAPFISAPKASKRQLANTFSATDGRCLGILLHHALRIESDGMTCMHSCRVHLTANLCGLGRHCTAILSGLLHSARAPSSERRASVDVSCPGKGDAQVRSRVVSWGADKREKKLAGRGHILCNARLFLVWQNQTPLPFVYDLEGGTSLEGKPDAYETQSALVKRHCAYC